LQQSISLIQFFRDLCGFSISVVDTNSLRRNNIQQRGLTLIPDTLIKSEQPLWIGLAEAAEISNGNIPNCIDAVDIRERTPIFLWN